MHPMPTNNAMAGSNADGESPHAAIPAGSPSTPAPTMLLMRFKTSFGMDAPTDFAGSAIFLLAVAVTVAAAPPRTNGNDERRRRRRLRAGTS